MLLLDDFLHYRGPGAFYYATLFNGQKKWSAKRLTKAGSWQ